MHADAYFEAAASAGAVWVAAVVPMLKASNVSSWTVPSAIVEQRTPVMPSAVIVVAAFP